MSSRPLIQGRAQVLIGDTTTHGGIVISGSPTTVVTGRPIARMGDMVTCPLCTPHVFPIVEGLPMFTDNFMPVALHGHKTACGATLIAMAAPVPPPPAPSKGGGAADKIPKQCDYLNGGETVEADKSQFNAMRKKTTVSKPTEITHVFPGQTKAEPALQYEITARGKKITTIVPKNSASPTKRTVASVGQIEKALGVVPAQQLQSINRVVVSPYANPDDAYWEKEYGMKDFVSAATGGENEVTFYPSGTADNQSNMDSTMLHEGAHTFQSDAFAKDPALQAKWDAAIKSDKDKPSNYAGSSPGEDFAESAVMYALSKGSACEEHAKKKYPARYKFFNELMEPKKK